MTICTARSAPRAICSQGRLAFAATFTPPEDRLASANAKPANAQ